MTNERVIQLQFALFFENKVKRPDKFIYNIDEAFEGVFDKMPTIVPIPEDAPPEIPRVTMQSSDGAYVCNISINRIDFVMNGTNSGDSISVTLEKFLKKVRIFAQVVFDSIRITRFGFVGRYFIGQKNPVNRIQSKYFKNDIGEVSEIGIRFNKRFKMNDITCNDNIEISQGSVIELNGPQEDGIMINRDMNNVPKGLLQLEDILSILKYRQDNFKLSGILELI